MSRNRITSVSFVHSGTRLVGRCYLSQFLCPVQKRQLCFHLASRRLRPQLHFTILSKFNAMTDADFNFSRVSQRDELAHGSSRPGFPSKEATLDDVGLWVEFMKSKEVKHVLSLLGDDEKEFYEVDIDTAMTEAFGKSNYTRSSVFKEDAKEKMLSAIKNAREANEAIVIHCSGGSGRAALGVGLWLMDTYGIDAENAAKEIHEETARYPGISRELNVEKLTYLVANGSMIGFKK